MDLTFLLLSTSHLSLPTIPRGCLLKKSHVYLPSLFLNKREREKTGKPAPINFPWPNLLNHQKKILVMQLPELRFTILESLKIFFKRRFYSGMRDIYSFEKWYSLLSDFNLLDSLSIRGVNFVRPHTKFYSTRKCDVFS